MYKKILGLVILFVLIFAVSLSAGAETDVKNVYISRAAVSSSGFSEYVMIETVDTLGVKTIYNCDKKTKVNGSFYKNMESLEAAIKGNVFAKMAVEDGVVKVISFSEDVKGYSDTSYNKKKKTFNVLNVKERSLPVYYKYNGEFAPAHLDENHYYDIDVYEYGICINDMQSKTMDETIRLIDVSTGISGDFSQNINAYCESTVQDGVLKGDLYNDGKLIESRNIPHSGDGEIDFRVDDADAAYILKIWIEDRNGNRVSEVYTKECMVEKADIRSAYIEQSTLDEMSINEKVLIRTVSESGEKTVYECERNIRINGTRCRTAEDILSNLQTEVFAKIAVDGDSVQVIKYETQAESLADAEYNEETGCFGEAEEKPVYYKYDGDFVAAHLDENHYYDIDVYEYGICINDMQSKTMDETIRLIDVSTGISGDFSQHINVYCESTAQDGFIKGELYNKGKLIASAEAPYDEEIQFGVEDAAAYTAKVWLEDRSGNRVSEVYTKECTVEKADIRNVYIEQIAPDETAINEKVLIRTVSESGEKTVYECERNIRINGTRCRTAEDILSNLQAEVFARIALHGDSVQVIRYDTQSESFADAEYNGEGFDGTDKKPIYYKYDGEIVSPYLDENHYYDIDVYEYGICINDMRSKTMDETIRLIDVSTGISGDFSQNINVYCESTVQNGVLNGELYETRRKKIRRSMAVISRDGELVFNAPINGETVDEIRLWIEDEQGNRLSNIYILEPDFAEREIEYGKIVMTYTEASGDDESVMLNVLSVNGEDDVYVCDKDLLVVNDQPGYSLCLASTEIQENVFAKMAVEDGVVKVINFEPYSVEKSVSEFDFTDNILDGNIWIMNNSTQPESFDCLVAVYNESDIIKEMSVSSVSLEIGQDIYITPLLENYSYEDGDYAEVFILKNNDIVPLLDFEQTYINKK